MNNLLSHLESSVFSRINGSTKSTVLVKDVTILFQVPKTQQQKFTLLRKGIDLPLVIKSLNQIFETNADCQEILLIYENKNDNLNVEVNNTTVFFDNYQVALSINDLKDDMRLKIQFIRDNIRSKMSIGSLILNYRLNECMQKKIRQLSKIYSSWRPIRGDGNCYYRAIIFGFIEQIIINDRRYILYQFIDTLLKIEFNDDDKKDELVTHDRLLKSLFDAAGKFVAFLCY
jgi:hypothetical protein